MAATMTWAAPSMARLPWDITAIDAHDRGRHAAIYSPAGRPRRVDWRVAGADRHGRADLARPPPADRGAWICAFGVLAIGLAAYTLRGARGRLAD
jgi:hypothetical protein